MRIAVPSVFRSGSVLLSLAAAATFLTAPISAQPLSAQAGSPAPIAQANRVPASPSFASQTQLTGHLPVWVTQGAQVASHPVDLSASLRLTVVVRRAPAVEAAFEQFLAAQQTPGSPSYHQWLTPQQVGALFGPTASDLAALTSWLTAQGLSIDEVAPSGVMINIHAPIAAVGNAFRTSFAYFDLNGTPRLSAVSEPSVPSVLAPLFNTIHGLTDIPVFPTSHIAPAQPGWAAHASSPSAATPLFTAGPSNGVYYHYMTPNDFAVIYDVNSVYNGGNKGATIGSKAQHVAIIGQSRVNALDISEYATAVGIAAYTVNTIIPTTGVDPGAVCTTTSCSTGGDQGEQTLDVDRVIGTSPGAQADLVVSSASTGGGIDTAAQYNVNTLLDPVMTISYGGCEGQSGNVTGSADAYWNTIFMTGAGEGISSFASSGDSAANGCSTAFVAPTKANTASINFICGSQYVTCVGGTEFNDTTGNYWATTNGAGLESALSYIPEGGWNEPTSCGSGTDCPSGSGGGASTFITKPTWQTGTGVPADGARDTPDVAYPAAGHDGYYACLAFEGSGYDCAQNGGVIFSGTSAAAPTMAGVAALLNTKAGIAEGNLNPLLYKLAANSPTAFHDITVASSGVSPCVITTPSMCNNSSPGVGSNSTAATYGVQGYLVGTGYDEVTGLGSLDVANFISAATATTTISTTLAITATTNPISAGQTDTFKATLTPASVSPNGAATGTVQFYSNGVAFGTAVAIVNNVATSAAQAFPTAGTYSITATYVGDTNYAGSTTTTAVSLVVNSAPSFSITPASTTLTLFAGATTGNTDTITLASLNSFAGAVALTCTVTNASGTAAGTCGVAPASVTLAAGGPGSSVLTINTTPGTSGTLSVTVTGTNGTTSAVSPTITVTLTAASFTMTATPATLTVTSGATTGNTSVVTLTSVNGFAGTVAVTCAVTSNVGSASGSCTTSPGSVVLAANGTATTTVTLTSTAGTAGTLTLTVSGSGPPTGGTVLATAKTTISATLITPTVTLTASQPTAVTSGTPATSTVTVTSADNFAGSVALTCSILATSGSPAYPATCGVAPGSVNVTATVPGSATVTITSTTASANATPIHAGLDRFGWTAGALFATLLCLLPFRRRRAFRALAAFALLAIGLASLTGCGGGGTPAAPVKSSAGTYTVTVTATSTGFSTPVTTAFTVQIN